MDTSNYYERAKLKHPEVSEAWVTRVLNNPHHTEIQPNGRIRYYGYIEEIDKWLRVIVDNDELFNRFLDRKAMRKWG